MNRGPVLIFFVIILATAIAIAMFMNYQAVQRKKDFLKIYNPSDVDPQLVDTSLQNKGEGHLVGDFTLTDQYGKIISQKDLKGKILVVDFFFTTCQGICPQMTNLMKKVQSAFEDEDKVVILSHTVIPEDDSVEVMRTYAEMNGAIQNKWYFLTGDKKEIYRMARENYFVLKKAAVGEGDGGKSDFIHTENFVLVDAKRQIRGYYDGTSAEEVDKLIHDIHTLLEE